MPSLPNIAWNGISLCSPASWEPSILERDFMRLEQDGHPMAELKWKRLSGPFEANKYIRKVGRKFRDADIREFAPSTEWDGAVESLRSSGLQVNLLRWEETIGAVLYSKATGLAALVQFFIPEISMAPILASFRDHWNGDTLPWRIFGIQARLPADLLLKSFSFRPGHYTLQFRRPKRMLRVDFKPQELRRGHGANVTLERLAPADAMLGERDFQIWAKENYQKVFDGEMVFENKILFWKMAQRRFLRRTMFYAGRAWLDATANSVFSVTTQGELELSPDEFSRICDEYGPI